VIADLVLLVLRIMAAEERPMALAVLPLKVLLTQGARPLFVRQDEIEGVNASSRRTS